MSFGIHPSGYGRRIEIALLAAGLLHAIAFVVMPPYVARPYHLPSTPLRVVATGGFGVERAPIETGPVPASAPAAPVALARTPAILTEQLRMESGKEAPAAGAGVSPAQPGVGGAEGTDAGEPPLFYAFDSPPEIVSRVEPEYPLAARIAGAEGLVVLNANVSTSGRVMRVWVARSTAPEALVESAIDAMYRFRFTPGSQQGIPVPCTVAVPFNFRLNLRIESSGGKS